MSALLTTTMPYMKVVIQTLKDRGIRDDYIVLVGGAPLNEEFGAAVGADAYCRDAGRGRRDRAPAHRRAPRQCGLTPRARPPTDDAARPIVGCGALARELLALTAGIPGVEVDGVDARLHMRPERIADARRGQDRQGPRARTAPTSGSSSPTPTAARAARSTPYLAREGVERIAGAHCFEFYAGAAAYAALRTRSSARST